MPLTPADLDLVQDALKRVSFHDALSAREFEELVRAFEKHKMKKGETLITQGKAGGVFYVLASGSVGVYHEAKLLSTKLATLGPGSFFGEIALLTNDPRSANVVCEADGVVFTLSQRDFHKIILGNPQIGHLVRQTARERTSKIRDVELSQRTRKQER